MSAFFPSTQRIPEEISDKNNALVSSVDMMGTSSVCAAVGDVSLTRGNTPTTPSTPLTPTAHNNSDNSVFAPVFIGGLVTPSSGGSFSLSPGPPPPPYPAPTRPLSPLPPPLPPRRKRESSLGDTSPKVKQAADAPILPPRDSSPPPPLPPRREATAAVSSSSGALGSSAVPSSLASLPRAHSIAAISSRAIPFPGPTSPHIPPRPHPHQQQQQHAHHHAQFMASNETFQNHSAFRFPPTLPPPHPSDSASSGIGSTSSIASSTSSSTNALPPFSRRHSSMDVSPGVAPLSPSPFHQHDSSSRSSMAPSLHPPMVPPLPRRFSTLNGGPPLHSPPLLPQTTEPRSPAQYR